MPISIFLACNVPVPDLEPFGEGCTINNSRRAKTQAHFHRSCDGSLLSHALKLSLLQYQYFLFHAAFSRNLLYFIAAIQRQATDTKTITPHGSVCSRGSKLERSASAERCAYGNISKPLRFDLTRLQFSSHEN